MYRFVNYMPEIPRWLGISGVLLYVFWTGVVQAQSITTHGGDGNFGFSGDGGAATSASLADPSGVFVDTAGSVYVVDTSNRRVRKIDAAGVITTVAGNGSFGFGGDGGQATDATLADPSGVFLDSAGNVYIADTNNQRIRKVDLAGTITTIAGDGNAGFSGDGGAATAARLNFPTGVVVDATGNVYFSDRSNHRIRKIDTQGMITTVAGTGAFGSSGDGGTATTASLAFPAGIFIDGANNLYIADRFNFKVRKVDASGIISTVAGNGAFGSSGDGGQATDASLGFPSAVFVNTDGEILIADRDNHKVRKVDASGVITTVVGNGTATFSGDGGAATSASLNRPSGIYADTLGAVYIADTDNRRVRKVAPPMYVSTPAQGLSSTNTVAPGAETLIFSIGITGDGVSSMSELKITVSDLSTLTGLATGDFESLRLYESTDAVLGGDTQLASQATVQIGTTLLLTPASPVVIPNETERFYLVTAVINNSVTDGHAFRVGFASGDVTTSVGGLGAAVVPSDNDRVAIDVVATQLVFSTQASGSSSGKILNTQPIVTAQDAFGNTDLNFVDVVSLGESSAGSLAGGSVTAINGVATFTDVVYTASVDGESFTLVADDVAGGVEGDLAPVSGVAVTSDVLATQLVFTTQGSGSVSGKALVTQPVVVAQDSSGAVDVDFADVVSLGESSAGSLAGGSVTAINGVATFTDVVYTASADGESFTLVADDVVGGVEGDLAPVSGVAVTSDVLATQLVFTTQGSGSVSGKALVTQPVVVAQDSSGAVDVDFVDVVSLSESSSGSLAGGSVTAVNGVATFTDVVYTASADGESFTLVADDVAGGVEGDLVAVSGVAVTSDVLATQLVFTTQGSGSVSGKALVTQPVVVAQDSSGAVDVDFADVVSLGESSAGSLAGGSVTAINGVATFTDVVYTASADGESFTLVADDVVGGVEGDLAPVSGVAVTSDVLATQLVFTTQGSGSVSGKALVTQPVVVAQDSSGAVDVDFVDVVSLSESSAGSLAGGSVTAINGVATFTDVVYTASADGESFTLVADDVVGGVEGDLAPVSGVAVTSDVLATQLVFTTQGSGSVSGKALVTQPVVVAQDSSGAVDVDFVDVVSLSESSSGSLAGGSVTAINGVATFTDVVYTASADGESFTFVADDVAGGVEGDLASISGSSINSDIVATRLVFETQPASSVSGSALTVQPVVVAQDDSGMVDVHFADIVTLEEGSAGSLSGGSVAAVNGVATFNNVIYTASTDKENFVLVVNDEVGGVEGKLPVLTSQTIQSEVVATQLAFLIQPSGSISGQPLSVQPLVVARDSSGVIDVDFTGQVTLSVDGQGTLENGIVQAVSGVATFLSVSYNVAAGQETFRIIAQGGSLLPAESLDISSQVVATQLVFVIQPAGSVSGQPLAVQPIVEAQDANGIRDVGFSDTVTLAVDGPGNIEGHVVVAESGRAVFSDLRYQATTDGAVFALIADDLPGGLEGDLAIVTSESTLSDVVATRLVFVTEPSGSVSGQPLTTQPVLAAQDSAGVVDTDVIETVNLTTDASGFLQNDSVVLQNGIGTFQDLKYFASSDGESFTLTARDAVGGISLLEDMSTVINCDVVATRLVFTVQPAGSVSGKPLTTQPVISAQDSSGITDLDVSETVTLTASAGVGELANNEVTLQNGVGFFSGLAFTASVDQQMLVLTADDLPGGDDFVSVMSDSFGCDVVANELVFATQPFGLQSGQPLDVQPVIVAQYFGVVDLDFNDVVLLNAVGSGSLQGGLTTAVSGVAAFSDLLYYAAADKETVSFVADDSGGGIEGDLLAVVSDTLTAEVVASRLTFLAVPSGIISGQPFLTQPIIAAQDSLGITDVDFSERVSLTANGAGQLLSTSVFALEGVATFADAIYTASQSLESFVLSADDEPGGIEGDLSPISSLPLTAGSGPAHRLDLLWDTTEFIANGTASRSVLVRVLDGNGNLRLDDELTEVSLAVSGAATGGGVQRVSQGVATFPVVSSTQTGAVLLHAASIGLIAASDTFQAVAGPAARLHVVFDQTPLLADGESTRDVILELLDANDNLLVNDSTSMVALGVSGAGSGGGTKRVEAGVASFRVQAGTTSGLLKLRANASGLDEVVATMVVGSVVPDLVVAKTFEGPSQISRGETHQTFLDLQNIGTGPTEGSFNVALFLVGGLDSVRIGESTITQRLDPEGIVRVELSFVVPPFSFTSPTQVFRWAVKVDDGNFIAESSEANNQGSGNAVRFPVLSISDQHLDFGPTLLDSIADRFVFVENHGQVALTLDLTTTDSQLTVSPASSVSLEPGDNLLVKVSLRPNVSENFLGSVIFASNDPKGDVVVSVQSTVVVSDRVLLDFDPETGNQSLTQLSLGRDETFPVQIFLRNLPSLQAITVELKYDPDILSFEPGSWEIGEFFSGGVPVFEEASPVPGQLEVSVGAFAHAGISFEGRLGQLKFSTARVLPQSQDVLETALEAVRIRYLQADGKRDSLNVFALATIQLGSGTMWPDLDGDGMVNFLDFLVFIGAFRQDETSPGWHVELADRPFPQTPYKRFDIDGDGRIGFFDFVTYAQDFKTALDGQ